MNEYVAFLKEDDANVVRCGWCHDHITEIVDFLGARRYLVLGEGWDRGRMNGGVRKLIPLAKAKMRAGRSPTYRRPAVTGDKGRDSYWFMLEFPSRIECQHCGSVNVLNAGPLGVAASDSWRG